MRNKIEVVILSRLADLPQVWLLEYIGHHTDILAASAKTGRPKPRMVYIWRNKTWLGWGADLSREDMAKIQRQRSIAK